MRAVRKTEYEEKWTNLLEEINYGWAFGQFQY